MNVQQQNNFDGSVVKYGTGKGGFILKESLEEYIHHIRRFLYDGLNGGSSYSAVVSTIRIDLFNNVSKVMTNLSKTMYNLGNNTYYPDALLKLTKQSPDKEISNYNITRTNLSAVYKVIEYMTKNGATTRGGGSITYPLLANNAEVESITIPKIFNVTGLSNSGKLKLSPGGVTKTLTILVIKKDGLNYLTPIHTYETPKSTSNAVRDFVNTLRSQGMSSVSYLSVVSTSIDAYANILPWLVGDYANILNTNAGYSNRIAEKGRLVDVLETNNISVESLWLTVHALTQSSYTVTEKQVKAKKRVKMPIKESTSRDVTLTFTYANLPKAIFNITKFSPKSELSVSNKSLVATDKIKFSNNGFVKGLKKLPSSVSTTTVSLPYRPEKAPVVAKKGPTYNIKEMYRVYVRSNPINVYVPSNNMEALLVLTKLYGGVVEPDTNGFSDIALSEQNFKTTSYEHAQDQYNELNSKIMGYQQYYNPSNQGYNYPTQAQNVPASTPYVPQPFNPNANPNMNPNANSNPNMNPNANSNPNMNPNANVNVNPNVNPNMNPNPSVNTNITAQRSSIPI